MRARIIDLDVTGFGFRSRIGYRRRPLWMGLQRSNSIDAPRDAIMQAAELGVRVRNPERLVSAGTLRGGADADMAGVAWTDSAGHTLLGVPIPWRNSSGPDDPCTWLRV